MNDMAHQWFFNTKTGKPELGPQSPANVRLGPYRTREDALRAWEIVRNRNRKWDSDDASWNSWSPAHSDSQDEHGSGENTNEGH